MSAPLELKPSKYWKPSEAYKKELLIHKSKGHEAEALSWLQYNGDRNTLAANRFSSNREAVEAVISLYEAGATSVELWSHGRVPLTRGGDISRDWTEYSDELTVYALPEALGPVLKAIKDLGPDNWESDSFDVGAWKRDLDMLKRGEPMSLTLSWD